jgi:AcrR family transcriptional regulator
MSIVCREVLRLEKVTNKPGQAGAGGVKRMKTDIWLYRGASMILILFALAHSVGFLRFQSPSEEGRRVWAEMISVHFAVGRHTFSYGGFYLGFGLTISQFREKFELEILSEILHLAREEFVHEGYRGFSMRRIAGLVCCVPSALYKHFACENEIFDCLLEESFTALMQASSSVEGIRGENRIVCLNRGIWAYMTFGLKHPDHYRFAFLLQSLDGTRTPSPNKTYQALNGRIRRSIEAGDFPEGDLDLMVQCLGALTHGTTSLLIQKSLFQWASRQQLISQIVDAALMGLMQPRHKEGGKDDLG